MKVLLTTARCNPPLTIKIVCSALRYFSRGKKLSMYNEKGYLIRIAYIDDWQAISYIDDKGQEHFIKRA